MRVSKKTKGILITVTAIVAVIMVTISLCLYYMLFVYGTYQPYSPEQRQVLMKNFDGVSLSADETAVIKRNIDNENPINLIDYDGSYSALPQFWESLPIEVRETSAVVLKFDEVLRPAHGDELNDVDKFIKKCGDASIPFVADVLTSSSQYEWFLPLSYIEEKFLKSENCVAVSVNKTYDAAKMRGDLDGNFAGYIADIIRLCAKNGRYLIWSECNVGGSDGILTKWIENNEYLYSAMLSKAAYIIMLADDAVYTRSTYSLMLGLYLSGLIGNWGVTTDVNAYKSGGATEETAYNGQSNIKQTGTIKTGDLKYDSIVLTAAYGAACYYYSSETDAAYKTDGFNYAVMPYIKSIESGSFAIPSKQEVYDKVTFAVVGSQNFDYFENNDENFPSLPYGIIPLLPSNLRAAERQVFTDNKIQLIEAELTPSIIKDYEDNSGNSAYLTRTGSAWYYVNNGGEYGTGNADNIYNNGAVSFAIDSESETYAIIRENALTLEFSINNYTHAAGGNKSSIGDNLRETVIEVVVQNGEIPTVEFAENDIYTTKYLQNVEIIGNRAVITIMHNGSVQFTVTTGAPRGLEPPAKNDVENAVIKTHDNNDYTQCEIILNTIDTLMADRHNYAAVSVWQFLDYRYSVERALNEKNLDENEFTALIADYSYQWNLLIDISEQIRVLGLYKSTGDEKLDKAFDILMRELLSPTDYVEGKENADTLGFPYSKSVYDHNLKKIKTTEINKAQKKLHTILLEKGLYTV